MKLFLIGYPSDVGGANTECWHLVRILRRFGVAVSLIPTWEADPAWRARLDSIGCRTVECEPTRLADVPDLPGSIVLSLCNRPFLEAVHRFRSLGCRIVWVNCMNWLFANERFHCRTNGSFDRYVFQSQFQRDQLEPQLKRFGYQPFQGALIRGAFCVDDFPFAPLRHGHRERFLVGRIGRPDPDKWHPAFWRVFDRCPHPVSARVLGWDQSLSERLGEPPAGTEGYSSGTLTAAQFLPAVQALLQLNGPNTTENWPRVGLEAMAAGVPVIADDRGGWREMIQHGRTGFLVNGTDEAAYCLARLAYDEPYRLQITQNAREAVEELADPEIIGPQWLRLLKGLEDDGSGPQDPGGDRRIEAALPVAG